MSAAAGGVRRLRVGVYNRFWRTAGGGEKFAGGIAQALAGRHEVELMGHDDVDASRLSALADRLQLDLSGVGWRTVGRSPTEIEAASAGYELFINVSYGSVLRNRAPHGLYVVHFPTIGAPPPSGWRRFLLRSVGRSAKITGASLDVGRWTGGVYTAEPLGPLTHRWTDGDGVLQLTSVRTVRLVLSRLTAAGGVPVSVQARTADGRIVGSTTVRPPAGRRGLPVSLLTARLPEPGPGAGGSVLHVVCPTRLPGGRASDQRRLGASVVAELGGPWYQQLLQRVEQPLRVGSADLSFLDSYQQVVSNSAFTARWVRQLWGVDSDILNPPVSAQPQGDKEPVILHVGRFFSPEAGHSKRQLELVRAFRELVGRGAAQGWTLHLVGGCDEEGRAYLDQVRAEIGDLPVVLHVNAAAAELRALFARAAIYWHATGLGLDPDAHPERMEHFGIATVEAMSAGAVPVAIGVAGQLEVFDDAVEGFHFHDLDGLVARSAELIADPVRRQAMSEAALQRAERYGEAAFERRMQSLADDLAG